MGQQDKGILNLILVPDNILDMEVFSIPGCLFMLGQQESTFEYEILEITEIDIAKELCTGI